MTSGNRKRLLLVFLVLLVAGVATTAGRRHPPPREPRPPRDDQVWATTVEVTNTGAAQNGSTPKVDLLTLPVALAAQPAENDLAQQVADLALINALHEAHAEHAHQMELLALARSGDAREAFLEAFDLGDELFETQFNVLDGVGANVGNGLRFSQMPRADLDGEGEWANHTPRRITGPNAEACNDCHGEPFDDGAGRAANNNTRDPLHSGDLSQFIQRNTPHVFGAGAIQVLAEEMTEQLHSQRDQLAALACAQQQTVVQSLSANGVYFGSLTARPSGASPCSASVDTSKVVGVDADLVIKPFQWKGVNTFIRQFNRDAAHQELGMQSVETTGDNVDGDYDGVVNELTIGDQTALAIYLAAQPRPTTLLELADLGLVEPLPATTAESIRNGERLFDQIGCTTCHVAQMTLADPIFREPSDNANFRDSVFPAGQDPVARGLDPAAPIWFDLTADQPNNVVERVGADGVTEVVRLGSLKTDADQRALVELYGDMKRHDLGSGVAESIDDEGIPASVFLTENLWGVGSTAPNLHDGRATTLGEAILLHGGDAEWTQARFAALDDQAQADVIAFLENLVLFKVE